MRLICAVAVAWFVIMPSSRAQQSPGGSAPASGLVGYWPFDEVSGSVAHDASGFANSGSLLCKGNCALPTWNAGARHGALDFSSNNQSVSVSDSPSLDFSSQFTVSFWLYKSAGASSLYYLTKGSALAIATNSPESEMHAALYNGGTQVARCAISGVLDQIWQHFAITFDGSNLAFYVNGAPSTTCSASGAAGMSFAGAVSIGGPNTAHATGILDEVRIYNTALNAQQVAGVYNDPGLSPSTISVTSVSLSPSGATLQCKGSQQFTATVTGSTNTAVSWSASPAIGAISSTGLYSAPAGIPAAQVVTVTATSVANPSVSASATINLQPVAISLSPANASARASGTVQLTAAVTGSSNTAVTWSISPSVGSISSAGLYTAPNSIGASQTVTVTATSAADSSKSASSSIALQPVVLTPAGRTLTFSTYLGGSSEDQGRGITADSNGNFYVVGGTSSPNFPIKNGLPVNTQMPTDPTCGENMDAYVSKFSATGELIWSTALGASNYDRAYDVVTDVNGNVYVGGRGGLGFPVTPGAFQTNFVGGVADTYGKDEAWIAKLNSNGAVLWASFVGQSSNTRSMTIDRDGNVYVGTVYDPTLPTPSWYTGAAFANAYQKTPNPTGDSGVAKISSDGTTVLWATWLFGNTNGLTCVGTIKLDPSGNVYILGNTTSTNLPTTSGAAQKTYGGGPEDLYLAKLSPDGSSVLYATYFGGNGDEFNNTHNMNVNNEGVVYVATHTTSTNLPTTPGAFQLHASATSQGTIEVAEFSATGGLLACTYLGGSSLEDVDGVSLDELGNVYLSGYTSSADFPVTPNAYQTKGTGWEAVFVEVKSDLSGLVYSTFIGNTGNELEMGRDNFVDSNGTFYMIGQAWGPGWPTVNPIQSVYNGGVNDTVVAVFAVAK